ncbi:hypothetical protein JZ751_016485 [Albula glossodonta]|uniref:Uncharacterized protein n=1 Tax=Albula glossodonta TaxID=121402 RepID=A0A8T2NYG7_9TELE|nr:hypothetical protein JZ751_016485 [Albula glossodonta]
MRGVLTSLPDPYQNVTAYTLISPSSNPPPTPPQDVDGRGCAGACTVPPTNYGQTHRHSDKTGLR